MQIWQDAIGRPVPPELSGGAVITIGNFDGVHQGHRKLIGQAYELSRKLSGEAQREIPLIILTFWPHSGEKVPGKKVRRIFTEEQKDTLIHEAAPEARLVQLAFDEDLRTMGEQEFFEEILLDRYQSKGLVVGEDFRYGFQGRGSVETLSAECRKAGIAFEAVPDLTIKTSNGEAQRISSTLIRELLSRGEIEQANTLLDTPYYVEGPVLHGKRLGRHLGFPTANLMLPEGLAEPRHGVYRTRVTTPFGVYTGVTNLGLNPTVEHGHRIKIETYLVGFEGDLYDRPIRVEFLAWLREEHKFPSVEALKEQLQSDISQAVLEAKKAGEK